MKEFAYFGKPILPLGDEIECEAKYENYYLIANKPAPNTQIHAREIDYYLESSDEDALEVSKNVSILYEARALAFDGSKFEKYSKTVGKRVLFIGTNPDMSLKANLEKLDFKVICLDEIKFIYGCAGELCAIIEQGLEQAEVECDFAVFFGGCESWATRQSGCFDASAISAKEILEFLSSHVPNYTYQNYIFCQNDACLYHHKRGDVCSKCVELCPTVAILKNEDEKELVFSPIDCIACGRCVGVCPSGAIDNAVITRTSFEALGRLFKSRIPIIAKDGFLPKVRFKNSVLPLVLPSDGILDFNNILSLVLGCGGEIFIFLPNMPKASKEAVALANEIFKARFGCELVRVFDDEISLQEAISKARYKNIGEFELGVYPNKASAISAKLALIAGSLDLGEFSTYESTAHGKISVDESKCTLCASCAGACPTSALITDSANNALCFNESLCIGCGYCVISCAESQTISLKKGKMHINTEFFKPKELARDELFACVECGKEFATKKAVEKIASILSPAFSGDEKKLRTLYCCAECKAKLMILSQSDEGVLDV